MCETKIEIQRELLQEILSSIPEVRKVYFQPPESRMLEYPCIIYELSDMSTLYSDNSRYLSFPEYTVTVIDKNPESIIQKRMMDLSSDCHVDFNRFFTSDNLNHWVYTLVFSKALW